MEGYSTFPKAHHQMQFCVTHRERDNLSAEVQLVYSITPANRAEDQSSLFSNMQLGIEQSFCGSYDLDNEDILLEWETSQS